MPSGAPYRFGAYKIVGETRCIADFQIDGALGSSGHNPTAGAFTGLFLHRRNATSAFGQAGVHYP